MSENTATTTNGVSSLGFEVCGAVVTLGKNKDMQAVIGGDDAEGYIMVATDAVTVEYDKGVIKNGPNAQVPAKTGENPEKDGNNDREDTPDIDDNSRN